MSMTNFLRNIQRTRPCLWYRNPSVINCMYANADDLNMTTSYIHQWGESRYLCRSPCRMKTTAVVFISLPGKFMPSVLTTWPCPVRQKRTDTSRMVSHTRHNNNVCDLVLNMLFCESCMTHYSGVTWANWRRNHWQLDFLFNSWFKFT